MNGVLQLLSLLLSAGTFALVWRAGIWMGRVEERLDEHQRRLGKLEKEQSYAMRSFNPGR